MSNNSKFLAQAKTNTVNDAFDYGPYTEAKGTSLHTADYRLFVDISPRAITCDRSPYAFVRYNLALMSNRRAEVDELSFDGR